LKQNKNKRKTIIKRTKIISKPVADSKKKTESILSSPNDDLNDQRSLSSTPDRKRCKWTDGRLVKNNIDMNHCSPCSINSKSNLDNNQSVEPISSNYINSTNAYHFHGSIENESLAAAVETDFKTRRKKLSDLKTSKVYAKLSAALDRRDFEENKSGILKDKTFTFTSNILSIINSPCDCTKNDDENMSNGCLRKIATGTTDGNIFLNYVIIYLIMHWIF
jgi:hypothetical protein